MSKRYGKPKKGRRNQPGYGSNQKCMVCSKILRNVQIDGELKKRCLNPKCADYYYRPPQSAEPPQPPQTPEVVKA